MRSFFVCDSLSCVFNAPLARGLQVYSPIVRTALNVVATCHAERRWGINGKRFEFLPYGMALNLADCDVDDVIITVALLHGACDRLSEFSYEEMEDLFGRFGEVGERVIYVHRQVSWSEAIKESSASLRNGDWSDYFRLWRAHVEHIGYQAIEVVCAETYFLVTELHGLYEVSEDPSVCEGFLTHFPVGPELSKVKEPDPYSLLMEYLEGMFAVFRRHRIRRSFRLHTETLKVFSQLRTILHIKGLI